MKKFICLFLFLLQFSCATKHSKRKKINDENRNVGLNLSIGFVFANNNKNDEFYMSYLQPYPDKIARMIYFLSLIKLTNIPRDEFSELKSYLLEKLNEDISKLSGNLVFDPQSASYEPDVLNIKKAPERRVVVNAKDQKTFKDLNKIIIDHLAEYRLKHKDKESQILIDKTYQNENFKAFIVVAESFSINDRDDLQIRKDKLIKKINDRIASQNIGPISLVAAVR